MLTRPDGKIVPMTVSWTCYTEALIFFILFQRLESGKRRRRKAGKKLCAELHLLHLLDLEVHRPNLIQLLTQLFKTNDFQFQQIYFRGRDETDSTDLSEHNYLNSYRTRYLSSNISRIESNFILFFIYLFCIVLLFSSRNSITL